MRPEATLPDNSTHYPLKQKARRVLSHLPGFLIPNYQSPISAYSSVTYNRLAFLYAGMPCMADQRASRPLMRHSVTNFPCLS